MNIINRHPICQCGQHDPFRSFILVALDSVGHDTSFHISSFVSCAATEEAASKVHELVSPSDGFQTTSDGLQPIAFFLFVPSGTTHLS